MEAYAGEHPRASDEAISMEEPASKLPCPDNRILNGEQLSDHGSVVVLSDLPELSRKLPKEIIEKRLNKQSRRFAQLALKLYNEREETVDHQLELINPLSRRVFWRRCAPKFCW